MSISFTAHQGTAASTSFYVNRSETGSLTVEFSQNAKFNTIAVTKTVTPALGLVTVVLSAPEVDLLKDAHFRVKNAGGSIIQTGIVDFVASTPQPLTVSDPALKTAYGAAIQRAGLRLSGGGSGTTQTGYTNLHSRTAFRFPVKPTRMRVHLWNRDVKGNGTPVTPGAITITGMYVGLSATDSTGNPTSAFAATPTQISSGFITDASGVNESVTPWVNVDLPPGRDLLLSYAMTSPSGQVHNRSIGQMWYSQPGTSLAVTDPALLAPAGMPAGLTTCWYDLWIEYETTDGAPHGIMIGDSLTAGNLATFPYRDGYASQASSTLGFAGTDASWSGSSISLDWQTSSPKWAAVSAVTRPSWVDIGLGTNDLGLGQTFAQVQASLGSLITQVRSIHGPDVPIYVRTIMPRSTFTGQTETDRKSFNTWIKTRPFGITGIFDIAALVTDPATGNTLLTAYNGGDGTHLNTEGYRLIATAVRPQWKFVRAAALP